MGNLGDTTLRALDTLKSVDLIAAEDTRRTRKLLSHFDIQKHLVSYHEHNEERCARRVVARIEEGDDVALVADSGTPLVSDPGYSLVSLCVEKGLEVFPVPGPCAAIAALSVCGLAPQPFYFAGFLPRRPGPRKRRLAGMAGLTCTMVFYESPHRVGACLGDMLEVFGDRRAVLARELTKLHEEVLRGRLGELAQSARMAGLKGEMVILVDGGDGC